MENVINNIVTVGEREVQLRRSAKSISAAPKIACSFQPNGRMTNGIMAAIATIASIPVTINPKFEVCRCKTDTLIHSTSAAAQMQGELDEYQSIVTWCCPGVSAFASYISRVGIVPI